MSDCRRSVLSRVLAFAALFTVAPLANAQPAGYHDGTFFVRSLDDVFRLYVQGRVHVDWTNAFGPGVSLLRPAQALTNGFYLRRARLELGGEFFRMWQWQLGAEFASGASIANVDGTQAQPSCAPDAAGALVCTNKASAVDAATVKPIPTDVFVNFGPSPWVNVQVGQFYLPFTLENRISDNTTPFLERSLLVRNVGAPGQRDIGVMFWGEAPNRVVYYAAGVFDGDGANRTNVDDRYDLSGRIVMRPLARVTRGPTRWAHVGFSARGGSRDATKVGYDLPALTTQEGFTFWKPTYTDSTGRTMHVIPSTQQWAIGADAFLPAGHFDLTTEIVYASSNTREAPDGQQVGSYSERLGTFVAYGWYAQLGYWFLGDHDVVGYPSYGRPRVLDLSTPEPRPRHGLQAVAKFELLRASYASSARGGTPDAKTPDGRLEVDVFELGINYWATRHLRVSVNYGYYFFPGSEPTSASTQGGPQQSAAQRAVAPAQLLQKGTDDVARDGAHDLHEMSARVGVQF